MQVLPPAPALEGPTTHQRAQPLGAEERVDAADGPDARAATGPRPGAHSGMTYHASAWLAYPSLSYLYTMYCLCRRTNTFFAVFKVFWNRVKLVPVAFGDKHLSKIQ